MNKRLLVGVDEFTLTLHTRDSENSNNWTATAESFIVRFIKLSRLTELFGEKISVSSKLPAGYTNGYMYETISGYFAVAYNDRFSNMGVIVKFSAEAWAWYQKRYCEVFGNKIQIHSFLNMAVSTEYHLRLTRIDITADYIDYGDTTDPNRIFDDIRNERLLIVDHNGRKTKRKLSDYGKDGLTQSVLIGSRKSNSKALLRIYDKRSEQVDRFGFRYFEAIKTKSWVRFEASYRSDYAHMIGQDLLMDIHTDVELSQFLASKILDKYRFVGIDGNYTEYTQDLLAVTENANYPALRSENPQNNSLKKSILYLIKGSGLFPTLFKFRAIWNEDGEHKLIDYLLDIYHSAFLPEAEKNRALIAWIKKNYATLKDLSISEILTYEDIPPKTALPPFDLIQLPTAKKITETPLPRNTPIPNHEDTKLNLTSEEISDEEFYKLFKKEI